MSILKDSDFYALRMVESIVARTRILLTFPQSGRIVPEKMQEDIREVFKGNYRIVYQIKPYGVRILRVANRFMLLEI
jgi:toxin ParE1/3/4